MAEEEPLVSDLILAVRNLSRRNDASSRKLYLAAILMKALERLPLVTPDVGIELYLYFEDDRGRDARSLAIDDQSVRIENCRSFFHDDGTDYESQTILEVGVGWRNTPYELCDVEEWVQFFLLMCDASRVKWEFDDYAESFINWNDTSTGKHFWKNLKRDFS